MEKNALAAKTFLFHFRRGSMLKYCVECPQYSIRLEALGYLRDCLSGRVKDNKW